MPKIPSKKRYSTKVTLHDVAKAAGVSVAAVSYVLNRNGSVGHAAAERIRQAVKTLHYRPNHCAIAMRTGKTKTIGLILPNLKNPFFPELAQSIENAARKQNYAVFLVDTQSSEETEIEGINHLIQHSVEGIIWSPATNNDTMAKYGNHIPTVVIDHPLPNYDSVSSNYSKGAALLAKSILTKGHQKIGIIAGPQSLESTRLKLEGLIKGLGKKARIVWKIENNFSVELNKEVQDHLLANKVSVVVAGNDMIAIGAINILNKAHITVPNDVSIVGLDDIPCSNIVSPRLTTMRQPLSKIGHEAVALLMRRIDEPNANKQQLALDVELIDRESLSKPR